LNDVVNSDVRQTRCQPAGATFPALGINFVQYKRGVLFENRPPIQAAIAAEAQKGEKFPTPGDA
jgi:hypothetical protein